jgi:hypothetical protein
MHGKQNKKNNDNSMNINELIQNVDKNLYEVKKQDKTKLLNQNRKSSAKTAFSFML